MTKAAYNPHPSNQWVKETLVEDYLDIARKNGVNPSSSDVEKLAIGDLTLTDAVERTAKPIAKPKPDSTAPIAAKAQNLASETGWELTKKPLQPQRARRSANFLNRRPQNPKQAAAIMRLGQILQPASWFRPSEGLDYVIPALAQSFAEMMQRLDRGLVEFQGKSDIDCERIAWRHIEDLCDKSTGKLGHWWVK